MKTRVIQEFIGGRMWYSIEVKFWGLLGFWQPWEGYFLSEKEAIKEAKYLIELEQQSRTQATKVVWRS